MNEEIKAQIEELSKQGFYLDGTMKEYKLAILMANKAWKCKEEWITDDMKQDSSLIIADIVEHGIDAELDNFLDEAGLTTAKWTEEEFEEYKERLKWCYIGAINMRIELDKPDENGKELYWLTGMQADYMADYGHTFSDDPEYDEESEEEE